MRTTSLIKFTRQLDTKVKELRTEYPALRVYQINAPRAKGDIECVLQKANGHLIAVTYTASGDWTIPSFWCEGQI